MDFFCDVVLWFVLLIGLILMFLPSDLFASIAQMKIVFPEALNTLAKILACLLYTSPASPRGQGSISSSLLASACQKQR